MLKSSKSIKTKIVNTAVKMNFFNNNDHIADFLN